MRRPNRISEKVEFLVYLRAFPLLLMNPILLLSPLLVSIVDEVLKETLGSSFAQFFVFLLDTFGLAVSIIIADMIWRRGRASFDEAWDDARRKAPDILLASIGLNFVLYFALYAGTIITWVVGVVLSVVAAVFLIYTIAAAAISGIPGPAALQKSIDTVRAAPINAVILTIVTFAVYLYVGTFVPILYFGMYGTITLIIGALFKAIALGYVALIMAQRFSTLNFSSRY